MAKFLINCADLNAGLEYMVEYLELVAEAIDMNRDEGSLLDAYRGILDAVRQRLEALTLGDMETVPYVDIVILFTRKPCLAMVNVK